MTEEQKRKCHTIIHTHAAAAAAGNAIPILGVGIAADFATMTTMTIALSKVFEADATTAAKLTAQKVSTKVAGKIASKAIQKTISKSPIKTASKFVPILGSLVSVAMLEKAGWDIADELERMYN